MTISMADIEALVDQFERSSWRRISLVADGIELSLSKDAVAGSPERTSSPPVPKVEPPSTTVPGPATSGGIVTAPSLGTFYRSPKPGAPAFVEPGSRVEEGQEVCLIEVMKLLTSVRARRSGIVREIYVEDGVLVEFGEALMSIEADG